MPAPAFWRSLALFLSGVVVGAATARPPMMLLIPVRRMRNRRRRGCHAELRRLEDRLIEVERRLDFRAELLDAWIRRWDEAP